MAWSLSERQLETPKRTRASDSSVKVPCRPNCGQCTTTYISLQFAHAATRSTSSYTPCYVRPADAFARAEPRCSECSAQGTRLQATHLRWRLLLWRQRWTGHQDPEWSPGDTSDTHRKNVKKMHNGLISLTMFDFWIFWIVTIHFQLLPVSNSIQICLYCCPQGGPWCLQSPNLRSECRLESRQVRQGVEHSHILHNLHHLHHLHYLPRLHHLHHPSPRALKHIGPWLRTSVPFTDLTT